MKNVTKKRRIALITAVLLSVALPVGIFFIIFGASKSVLPVMWLGIFLTVAGFYGCPMAWISFGNYKKYVVLGLIVEHDGLRKLSVIYSQLGADEKAGREIVNTAISQRYLTGYRISDDGLSLCEIEKTEKDKEKTYVVKCPSCGATSSVAKSDPRCPYCGAPLEIKR